MHRLLKTNINLWIVEKSLNLIEHFLVLCYILPERIYSALNQGQMTLHYTTNDQASGRQSLAQGGMLNYTDTISVHQSFGQDWYKQTDTKSSNQ